MRYRSFLVLVSFFCLLSGVTKRAIAGEGTPETRLEWSSFLGRQDLLWNRNPSSWSDGAFIGNGRLGAMIFVANGALGWEVNRSDVMHDGSRFPIGRLVLKTGGEISGGDARIGLWNAEATGTVKTDRGAVKWRTFAVTEPSVLVVELTSSGNEGDCALDWQPAEARPPRKMIRKEEFLPADLHPPAVVSRQSLETTSVQAFSGGGAHAESVLLAEKSEHRKVYFISVGFASDGQKAYSEAQAATAYAARLGLQKVVDDHRKWWHAYYPASFLTVPDARIEAFYWIQIYKLGSAMRESGPILDLMGPWFYITPWARIWWNLNIQLTYSPLFTANRLPQTESLFRALDRNRHHLIENVPPEIRDRAAAIGTNSDYDLVSPVNWGRGLASGGKVETGNLPWVTYLYWLYYRYQMDDAILRDRVLPLLKPAIGHYLAFIQKDSQGRWHLPPTFSPELTAVADCNYDLALLKWGLQTLIESHEHLSLDDPQLPLWREVLHSLTPFPEDATGLLIGRDFPLVESHRHYSHLLAIYPLHLLAPDDSERRELIEKSLQNWIGRPQRLTGYSYSGAASIQAVLGKGDEALANLNTLLQRAIKPNTFYTEGDNFPVIETPFSAVASLQEMLMQSWGGVIRVFPAVPASWPDVAFSTLRTEGAFLVSAVRQQGETAWVKVESLAGAPCRIEVKTWRNAVVRAYSGERPALSQSTAGNFEIRLAKGAWCVLSETEQHPLPSIAPTGRDDLERNPYPMRHRQSVP